MTKTNDVPRVPIRYADFERQISLVRVAVRDAEKALRNVDEQALYAAAERAQFAAFDLKSLVAYVFAEDFNAR